MLSRNFLQHQFRLGAGRTGAVFGVPIVGLAVMVQQLGEVGQGFGGYVAGGRVGEHVRFLQRIGLLAISILLEGLAPCQPGFAGRRTHRSAGYPGEKTLVYWSWAVGPPIFGRVSRSA